MRFLCVSDAFLIPASFDILASLSSSCILSNVFKPAKSFLCRHSQNNYQFQLCKLNLTFEKLSYQIAHTLAVNQAFFCYYQKTAKVIIKKTVLAKWRLRKYFFLNSFKSYLAKLTCVDFRKSVFLNIYLLSQYKSFYSTYSSIFWNLDFIRAIAINSCSLQHGAFVRQLYLHKT